MASRPGWPRDGLPGSLKARDICTTPRAGGGFYCEARVYPDAGLASLLLTKKTGFTNQKYLDRFDCLFL